MASHTSLLKAALLSYKTDIKEEPVDTRGGFIEEEPMASTSAESAAANAATKETPMVTTCMNIKVESVVDFTEPVAAVSNVIQQTTSSSTEPVTKLTDNSFYIDRSRIQTVGEDNQADELRSLGLHVYDQATLEQSILNQVDKALVEQDLRKLDAEMKVVRNDIDSCVMLLNRNRALFKRTSIKDTVTISKDTEKREKQLTSLKAKELSLVRKKDRLEGKTTVETNDDRTDERENEDEVTRDKETERERKIRLGEMTPFGTTIGSDTTVKEKSELEKYLESQAQLQQNRKKSRKRKASEDALSVHESEEFSRLLKPKSPKKKPVSPVKVKILKTKKRRKKDVVGSTTSSSSWRLKPQGPSLSERTELDGSGSEYCPSESEDEADLSGGEIKCQRAKPSRGKPARKEILSWGTDDSDWESSDEEEEMRKRRKSKKSIDDGNVADYQRRLKLWIEDKEISGDQDDKSCHELENGFKLLNSIWSKLYKYQQVGVQWLWELHQQRCGGILGDEMGLGKTIQVIAFLAGLSMSPVTDRHNCYEGLGPVLIVCPTTVMHQWVREFHKWWPPFRVSVLHESGSHAGTKRALIASLTRACVLITSYSSAVLHKDQLVARDWHYVVLDEGHKIRNPDAQVTITCKMLRTPHRIILSGSPMQNHLKELWSLFDFIFPGKLGTLPVFIAQLAVPITQGGYANATEVQVATAYRCARMLRDTIDPYLLRRMKSDVQAHIQLPAKSEQVLFCRLTDEQRSLYRAYIESPDVGRIIDGRMKVFVGLIQLRKICNHPDIYSGGPKIMRWENEEDFTEEQKYGFWRRAGKMLVVESLLKIWRRQGHRVLLFTQSRQMLCILEAFVQRRGYSYVKMDGSTSIGSRQPLVKRFNEDPSIFVFLLTTRVGGLGVNLTGADRVVIYDPDWNPATDLQARERAWRIGQMNNVTVYRLVTAGTIEEKIYHRQIFKQFLTNKVLRDPRQRRFFKTNDLFELFTLKDEQEGGSTETAAIFAGTNSEVKVDMSARSKISISPRKPKLSSSSVSSTTAELRRMKKLSHQVEKKVAPDRTADDPVRFSQSKLEHMKKLAQMLSQKIANCTDTGVPSQEKTRDEKKDENETKPFVNTIETCGEADVIPSRNRDNTGETHILPSDTKTDLQDSKDSLAFQASESKECINDLPKSEIPSLPVCSVRKSDKKHSGSSTKERRHRHSSKSKRKERGARFEGERIPYLVKQREAKSEQSALERSGREDDYVLKKLFKKSGLHEALHHDVIVGEGDPDYALVEGEAKRVAQEAVNALKQSRRQCWHAESGVPSWTGQSGTLNNPPSRRFGKKAALINHQRVETVTSATAAAQGSSAMSSQELIARIKERNRLTVKPDVTEPSQVSHEHSELLADVRNFLAFGGALDNSASTQEILDKFAEKLPKGMSPLFKCLLEQVAEFHRMESGEGMWRLRSEFRW